MKKLEPVSKVVIVLIAILAIGLFIYFIGYWIISTEWKREFSIEQVSKWTDSIENSEEIPENFDSIFNTIHPDARKNSIKTNYKNFVWKHLTGYWPKRRYERDSYSQKAAQIIENKDDRIWRNMFDKSLVLAFGIENFVTPTKCVDFYLNNLIINFNINESDSVIKIKGIKEIAKYRFRKEIYKLNEDEGLEVIAYIDLSEYQSNKYEFSKIVEYRKRILKEVLRRKRQK